MQEELVNKFEQEQPLRHPLAVVVRDDNNDTIKINKQLYRIVIDKNGAIDEATLRKKYDPYLDQYDFIVGDISSQHLRLKGFYRDNVKTAIDRKQNTIADYLIEYCNPGGAYFVLELISPVHRFTHPKTERPRPKRKHYQSSLQGGFKKRRVHKTKFPKKKTITSKKKKSYGRSFVIKKKG